MKRIKWNKKLLAWTASTFLLGAAIMPAAGAGWLEQITVRNGIRLSLNGEEVVPVDASGKEMPIFLYQNTTYVPVRFLSEKYGKKVEWDGKNATVHISDLQQEKPEESTPDEQAPSLSRKADLADLLNTETCLDQWGIYVSIGDRFPFILEGPGSSMTFRLNGQYETFNVQVLTTFMNRMESLEISGTTRSKETIVLTTGVVSQFSGLQSYSVKDLETLTIYKSPGVSSVPVLQACLFEPSS